jgi:hypothetical protein
MKRFAIVFVLVASAACSGKSKPASTTTGTGSGSGSAAIYGKLEICRGTVFGSPLIEHFARGRNISAGSSKCRVDGLRVA